MRVIVRVLGSLVVGCLVSAGAGCSSSDPVPDPAKSGSDLTIDQLRSALLKPADLGTTWTVAKEPGAPNTLVKLCAGEDAPPPVPGTPSMVSTSLADEGSEGAQTFNQVALVYPTDVEAGAGLAALQASADGCQPSVSVDEKVTADRKEPAYTETAATTPQRSGEWTGLVVERHKLYDPEHAAAADAAVVVLQRRNVVLVNAYTVYQLGSQSSAPQFGADWRRLVGTSLSRVPA